MPLSLIGDKMARASGLRSIMDDIATTSAEAGSVHWLNLGIGNPAPIPDVVSAWQYLATTAAAEDFPVASSCYGPSRGLPALIDAVADYFNERYGWAIGPENIMVGPGSQMLAFSAAALYTGPGTNGTRHLVLPVTPDYTGYQGLCLHRGGVTGIRPGVELQDDRRFVYRFDYAAVERQQAIGALLLSTPSNPAGRCLGPGELSMLVQLAEARGIPLLVDHAYGEPFPRIARTSVAPCWHENVINLFSLSKAGLPGERVGIAIGAEHYISPMVSFLANSALHAPRLVQTVVARALRTKQLDRLVSSVITPFYSARRALAEGLLDEMMPDIDWRIHSCQGGMFCWLWINHDWFDDAQFYQLMRKKHVFIVPGRHFFPEASGSGPGLPHVTQCFRISLTADESTLIEGIKRIAQALGEISCSTI